jgi:peptide/nickel transport system substrate-binding protein
MRRENILNKKAGVFAIVLCVMLITISFSGCVQEEGGKLAIKNPDILVRYTIGDAKTLDPADCYDTASSEPIFQIYETLVTYRGNDTKTFYPCLATDWTVSNDSLTWTFNLRQNVKFSNGNDFTAEDVKYSFDRVLIMDSP